MGKLRRSTPVNSDFIRDIFENDVSEKLKVTMRNGSMYVKIHILVLPDSFLRELLVATPECDQIIIPDKDIIVMEHLTKFLQAGMLNCNWVEDEYDELIQMMWDMLQFPQREFCWHEYGAMIRIGGKGKIIDRKREGREKIAKKKEKKSVLPVDDPCVCRFCGKHFIEPFTRKKHEESIHINKIDHQCTKCDITFRTKKGLMVHLESKHTQENQEFECNSCEKVYKNQSDLKRHIKTVHQGGKVEHRCEYCDYVAKRKDNLYSHLKHKHNQYNLKVSAIDKHFLENDFFTCDKCDRTMFSSKETSDHLSNNCKDFTCKTCKKLFSSQSNLNKHIKKFH